ncbi:MAG: hypothetical protein FJ213_13335 [Ignavibacteria bacterium]|nr:hypothetical protein [Ignavibacteria bacterium]
MVQNSKLTFEISDPRLEKSIPVVNQKISDNGIVALKWINTRNELSKHILSSLIDYQSSFWQSGKETDLIPLTLNKFLKLYHSKFLDKSRLSRLLPTLLVETLLDALKREVKEETNFDIMPISLVKVISSNSRLHLEFIVEAKYTGGIFIPSKDVDFYHWSDEKEITYYHDIIS